MGYSRRENLAELRFISHCLTGSIMDPNLLTFFIETERAK